MTGDLRLSAAETNARVQAGRAIVLDVVSPAAWDDLDVSIAGAVRISPEEIGDRYQELPRDRAIVAYCT